MGMMIPVWKTLLSVEGNRLLDGHHKNHLIMKITVQTKKLPSPRF